jgi:hypothetical protein
MKNQTFKAFGLAAVMFSGLGWTFSGTAAGSPVPQRPQVPRPMPMPTPRPMPTPTPRPTPVPRQAPQNQAPPRSEPRPAPHQDQTRQRQQQAEQQRQQQAQQQRQAQQQQAGRQAEQQRKAQREQKGRQEQARQQEQQGQQKQQAQQHQEQARQQKQQAQQQKHQAEEQKQAQKQQQKLQEKQNKEQARLQKERQKQQEKQRKEQERQQKKSKGSLGRSSSDTTAKSASASMIHSKGLTVKSAEGKQIGVRANGRVASYVDHGKTATFDRRGKVSSIHTANMEVHRGAHGESRIVSRRGNTTVVTTGRHSGYVERKIIVNNRTYTQRTVVLRGRVYTHTYVSYVVGGVALHHFVTPVFFAPGFYGWAYHPWRVPVFYSWGWFGAPWYVGPNPYFVAYPTYPGAAYWLTDYYLGQTLSAAAQEEADALTDGDDSDISADASSDSGDAAEMLRAGENTAITSEIKAAIAEEVKQQIAYDNTAAGDGNADAIHGELPAALRAVGHVFVVSDSLDVTTSDQRSCGLQAGDILRLAITPTDGTGIAELRVASSKKMDCPAGVQVTVSLQDLQDMQDNFREQVEQGLGVLQATQGQKGLPTAPADAVQIPPRPSLTEADKTAGTVSGIEALGLLETQQQEANALESEVKAAVASPKN